MNFLSIFLFGLFTAGSAHTGSSMALEPRLLTPCITSPSYAGNMQPFVNGCSRVVRGTITYVGGSMAVTWKPNETKYFDVNVYHSLSMATEE